MQRVNVEAYDTVDELQKFTDKVEQSINKIDPILFFEDACFMIKKEVIKEVGDFDEIFQEKGLRI